ncbi:hypothetical protein [Sphingobacterium sp. MYb382]|uniref:hypothetical protein n=1 Tax=Sphingobacterium sp. MYb382 TaxID=2745278 RepID=UPI0030A38588
MDAFKLTGGGIKMDILDIVTKQAVKRATTVALKKGKEEGLKKGKAEGLKEGLKEGKEDGLREGVLTVAREMKLAGVSLDEIARFTKLTIAELEGI